MARWNRIDIFVLFLFFILSFIFLFINRIGNNLNKKQIKFQKEDNKEIISEGLQESEAEGTKEQNRINFVPSTSKICDPDEVQENGGFCIDVDSIFVGGSNWIDGMVCKGMEDIMGNSTVADFGAGLGQYGRCLLRRFKHEKPNYSTIYYIYYNMLNQAMIYSRLHYRKQVVKSWEGFDGSLNVQKVSENLVKYLDLSKPFDLGKKYDWVVSLEVGEHIPKQYEDIFIENIIKHSVKGIIISWAIPGQNGLGHVNTRSNEYVISKFIAKGLLHDSISEDYIRKLAVHDYFADSLMVFRRPIYLMCK